MQWLFDYIDTFFESIALFIIVAFINPRFRLSYAKVVVIALISAGLTAALTQADLAGRTILIACADVLLLFLFIRKDFWIVISDIFIANILLFIIETVITFPLENFKIDIASNHILIIALLIAIIVIFDILERKRVGNALLEKIYRSNRKTIAWFTANVTFLTHMTILVFQENENFISDYGLIHIITIVLCIVVNLLFALSLIRIRSEKNKSLILQDYSEYLSSLNTQLRKVTHDHKNYLQGILAIADRLPDGAHKQELMQYIEHMELGAHMGSTSVIGQNTLLAAYLLHTEKRAKNAGIRFIVRQTRQGLRYQIPTPDLIDILENLFCNAFEEVAELQPDRQEVVAVFSENAIQIANDLQDPMTAQELADCRTDGFSKKGTDRGFGIPNVISLAAQHGIRLETWIHNGQYLSELAFDKHSS